MSDNRWTKTIAALKKELAHIVSSSQGIVGRLEILQQEVEPLKIRFLKYSLEKQREAMESERGFDSLIKDRKKLGAGLAVAAGGLIFGGLVTKNKYDALNAGLSGFNGVLQGFGETKWAVLLQKELVIVPYDAIPAKGTWVTLESLMAAIDDLEIEASEGKQLGTLDNFIQRLRMIHTKVLLNFVAERWVTKRFPNRLSSDILT
jgi:hypothetical protein